ncbi:hypothetical protein HYE67_011221 [Fusarium culmorum]|uniref:Ecp2 effector protein domain-containing protein n=1 Tax=Fusarium culmorum TaxID=5516 RepID=A0A2T4GHT0_FUSCU|nr:hypothetical protein FCULG_00009253 [Fusarium culmorum]QPC68990.1 hypothetical protein HYE67_011221 [Fusarium culmorum]
MPSIFTQRTMVFVLVLFLIVFLYDTCGPETDYSNIDVELDQDMLIASREDCICDDEPIDGFGKTYFPRSKFVGSSGGIITGWPARGGYYQLKCSLAELDYLGLDRFNPTNRTGDSKEEEVWCARLRQLGAKWYPNIYHILAEGGDGIEIPRLYLGWPADGGGVWALQSTKFNANLRGLGRINNAFTMEERWQKIKEYGGTFYADPKDCPYLDLDGSKEPDSKEIDRNPLYG